MLTFFAPDISQSSSVSQHSIFAEICSEKKSPHAIPVGIVQANTIVVDIVLIYLEFYTKQIHFQSVASIDLRMKHF